MYVLNKGGAMKIIKFITLYFILVFSIFPRDQVMVLCYHTFHGSSKKSQYDIALEDLKFQIDALIETGWKFVKYEDLVNGNIKGPRNVLITIDDGNKTALTAYRQILKPRGIRPLFAIYPNIISKQKYAMTWEELAELVKDGNSIAAHGFYHLKINEKLYHSNRKDFMNEIYKSKKVLEEKLSISVTSFVYPFGLKTDITVQTLKEAGYRHAFTLEQTPLVIPEHLEKKSLSLGRYMVTRDNYRGVIKRLQSTAKAAGT